MMNGSQLFYVFNSSTSSIMFFSVLGIGTEINRGLTIPL